jgi:excisionase family DNA binding protein
MTRLLHPIPEAAAQLGIGRSTMYELTGAGTIRTVKIGRRTLIAHEELERYVRDLARPSDQPRSGAA